MKYSWLLLMMMMVSGTEGGCIEEERKALLEIKTSLFHSLPDFSVDPLPSWVDDGGECCDWERVNCNTTTDHVIDLSLRNMIGTPKRYYYQHSDANDEVFHYACQKIKWTLNVSVFLHFKELTSLNLSSNCLDGIVNTDLKNLEILDLSGNYMEGFDQVSLLKKLEILNLGGNGFNESFITSLSILPMLKSLDLSDNQLSGTLFQVKECKRLSRLNKLKSITLGGNNFNNFNKSIIACLSALPFLKTLDLSGNFLGATYIFNLLILNFCFLALASFHHLEVLDLSGNELTGSIPSTINTLSSLKVLSFARNNLNGSLLPNEGLCELKNLHELDLSHNMLNGSMPQCFNHLSSLTLLDISSNRFTGTLMPSVIANLRSLEYVDFSNNLFEGSFSFSSLSNNSMLEVVRFMSNNSKFEVETEKPIGWIPTFQLRVIVLSGCNMNGRTGSFVPQFLLHQHMLQVIDLSNNSLVGPFPNWLIENNTMLNALILRKNSFSGIIHMPLHVNPNMRWLDVSENHMNGLIPDDLQKFLPYITYLNLSGNSLHDVIPSSIGHLMWLWELDLSENELSGEVPEELFTNIPFLIVLKLSKNSLHGEILSKNLSFSNIGLLALDSNGFTGEIGNWTNKVVILDISNNYFVGTIPHWISNNDDLHQLMVSNNRLEGKFPCGTTIFRYLDISLNSFSGPIPSCLNFQDMEHLHLGSNRFTGSIPNAFRNLTTSLLILDMGNNSLSGRIPEFLGELYNLRILSLRKNNFSGSIPMQLCQLSTVSLIDLSSNSLSGSLPRCLQNITTPIYLAFKQDYSDATGVSPYYEYLSVLRNRDPIFSNMMAIGTEDEVQFTTKTLSLAYKGSILDYMVGLDLSSNKLTGEIPKELGLLIEIRSMNLSHNQLSGPIPTTFSNLEMIESLDLSSNNLTGEVPSQLIQLHYLSVFNVSNNNLSGRLPDMKAQFSTFTKESYEGNPLLSGPPLEKNCTPTSQVNNPSTKEENDKWYDIDFLASFYGTWVVFMLGFAGVLYVNPYWRRRWLELVEECMYTCYYFLEDSVRKISRLFRK
ncbi:hypothetical protein OSB04_017223 [Centaurea solstitialis]|uniref:Leucine-rich repeat-containing N-terminal plant-type domain-containing protein n=1 Tax=Centaurea solstitialis TaxID=347529 RepID=A0AA38TMI3_9ASTR|nr:hypothetical protein OSB04_017223 [Centaurea solstitialis]